MVDRHHHCTAGFFYTIPKCDFCFAGWVAHMKKWDMMELLWWANDMKLGFIPLDANFQEWFLVCSSDVCWTKPHDIHEAFRIVATNLKEIVILDFRGPQLSHKPATEESHCLDLLGWSGKRWRKNMWKIYVLSNYHNYHPKRYACSSLLIMGNPLLLTIETYWNIPKL